MCVSSSISFFLKNLHSPYKVGIFVQSWISRLPNFMLQGRPLRLLFNMLVGDVPGLGVLGFDKCGRKDMGSPLPW